MVLISQTTLWRYLLTRNVSSHSSVLSLIQVDRISKQMGPEGIARQPELQEPNLPEELVKANLKPELLLRNFLFGIRLRPGDLLRRKEIVRRLLLKLRNSVFIDKFRSLRAGVKFGIRRDYGNYLHLIWKDLISEPKKFWSHFKKDKNNNHLPGKLYYNDKCFINDIGIADYFCSVFELSTEYDSNDDVAFNCCGVFVGIDTVTYDDVGMVVKELKSTSTIGIDNIPLLIIKGCDVFLVYPLLALFNLSLKTNTFPRAWKLTKIVPVFKTAGVVSPKLSRILLEKGAVSPPLAWIKKFEPIVTQDPMTIRKYLGKKS
ncbi:hypothetical protein AVEN_96156-1 [Araneus ventricosus]|uniref:Uncharacterized protein n=1 Tax=Araneus ventricosus TaxID=182803 RepID=A0A4Y2SF10_ARAVE|nr:hypothetical protein AVEN_87547-1 [Araneus ventricosus]GBN86176.1 hypothetical protein AVEN_96156-1 [Araneus ventricosus]